MDIGLKPIIKAVLESCVDEYNDTSIIYMVDFSTNWEIVVIRDVIFDEDVRCSSSQYSPLVIKKGEEAIIL